MFARMSLDGMGWRLRHMLEVTDAPLHVDIDLACFTGILVSSTLFLLYYVVPASNAWVLSRYGDLRHTWHNMRLDKRSTC